MLPNIAITDARSLNKRFNLYRDVNSRLQTLEFHEKIDRKQSKNYLESRTKLHKIKLQLDSNFTIPHTQYLAARQGFNKLGTTKAHMKNVFGWYGKPTGKGLTPDETIFLKNLAAMGVKARVSELRYRLETAIDESVKKGWFLIFQTLTVEVQHVETVFKKGSRVWSDYIRDFERGTGSAIYGSVREAERQRAAGNHWHKYFAVVEPGSKNGHLHIHCLHMLQELPGRSKSDPNIGLKIPYRREVNHLRNYWKYGYMKPFAVRMEADDAYTKLGWRWPSVETGEKTGIFEPYEAKPPIAVARYISKYVSKQYNQKNRSPFRCRMTRNLGMSKIKTLTKTTSDELLIALMQIGDRTPFLTHNRPSPPLRLIRLEAARESLIRLPSTKVWTFLRAIPDPLPIIERYRNLIRARQSNKSPNIGDLTTRSTTATDTSNFHELSTLWRSLNEPKSTGSRTAGPTNSPW